MRYGLMTILSTEIWKIKKCSHPGSQKEIFCACTKTLTRMRSQSSNIPTYSCPSYSFMTGYLQSLEHSDFRNSFNRFIRAYSHSWPTNSRKTWLKCFWCRGRSWASLYCFHGNWAPSHCSNDARSFH